MMSNLIIFSLIFFNLNIYCIFILIFFKRYLNKLLIYKNYIELISTYDNIKEIAFDNLYTSEISVHFTSGYNLTDDELTNFREEYVKSVSKLLGPSMWMDIEYIKGSTESILYELTLYFTNKISKNKLDFMLMNMDTDNN